MSTLFRLYEDGGIEIEDNSLEGFAHINRDELCAATLEQIALLQAVYVKDRLKAITGVGRIHDSHFNHGTVVIELYDPYKQAS